MEKKIIKVEDKKKSSKVDLGKIKDAIVDNKDTIVKIVDIATDLLDDDNKTTKKKTTSSKGTKSSSNKTKTTKKVSKSKSSDLETVIDIAGKLFK